MDELKRAIAFIAKDDRQAARKVAAGIRSTGDKLGERATGRQGRMSGTYEKSISGLPYIIAYAIHPAHAGKETVVILHVIHTARQWTPESWPKS